MSNTLLVDVAATLTTLAETGGGPESHVYLAMGCDLDRWYRAKTVLLRAGWATESANWIELTDAGKAKAALVAAALAK
jgi:hypothetical protein